MENPNHYYYCYRFLISCVVILLIVQVDAGHDINETIPLMGGKKLIICVPKSSFPQFVDLQFSPNNKTHLENIRGYSIDVFNATVNYLRSLGYDISFEFKAFVDNNGNSAGTYDELVCQIPDRKCDVVVGDVTIVANRSNYVDFTQPYIGTVVKMLVKDRHNGHLNMWIFVAPFRWDLWLSITVFCVFIGAILWFMERNAHRDGGVENSPRRASILWLPLVQIVLPEGESVGKNCSRFVLVLWLILAVILMQSYTANLSSMLTVNQLQPSYPSLNDLRNGQVKIGYQNGSFVRELLVDHLGIHETKLMNYSTIEEYKKALDLGSSKGGVDAIFDETPFVKFFLKKYSSNYAAVGTSYQTGGFGFAFPQGSNLTSSFSRAILNVTESGELENTKEYYFGSDDSEFQDQSSSSKTPSLTLYSFAGLFMVIGILALLALVVSESQIWWRKHVAMLATSYSQKMLTWSFKVANQLKEGSAVLPSNVGSSLDDQPNNYPRIRSRPLSSITDIETLSV